MLYRMVYDSGPPAAWWYSKPMTWRDLLSDIAWRRQAGFELPGHVVDASKPFVDGDPFAYAIRLPWNGR